jgi:flagellar motor protein MotB
MGLLYRRSEHVRWAPPAAGLILVVVLGGCSFVPDWADPTDWSYRWANPVNWYDGVFDDDNPEITLTTASGVSGEDDAFPELSSVPERPIAVETAEARAAVIEGLVADREQARYTDEVIRAGPAAAAEPVELAAVEPAFEERAPPPDAVLQEIEPLTPIDPAEPRQAMMLDPLEPMPEPLPANTMAPMEPLDGLTPLPTITALSQLELGASAAMPVAAVELVAYALGQEMLSEVFAQLLGESASTVTTAPANMVFSASVAKPMGASATAVPDVVRETYNAGLSDVAVSVDPAAFETSAATGGVFQSAVIKFNVGSSRISASDRNMLMDVVAEHAVRGGFIRVVGHASSRTRDLPVDRHLLINFRVSLDRAEAVARELVRLGASSGAVLIEARSDAEPVYYESMPAGEAENRRAEIFLEF